MTSAELGALKAAFYRLDAADVRRLAAELAAGDPLAALVCAALERTPETLEARAVALCEETAERLAAARRRAAA